MRLLAFLVLAYEEVQFDNKHCLVAVGNGMLGDPGGVEGGGVEVAGDEEGRAGGDEGMGYGAGGAGGAVDAAHGGCDDSDGWFDGGRLFLLVWLCCKG